MNQISSKNISESSMYKDSLQGYSRPQLLHKKGVWAQYDILFSPMPLMSGMWDGQSELSLELECYESHYESS